MLLQIEPVLDPQSWAAKVNDLTSLAVQYAPKLVGAVLVLLVGLRVVNYLSRMLQRAMEKSGVGPEIRPFLISIVSVLLKVLLIFSVAGIVGIETTSFVAMLAAAGFAIGIALQGSLENFAAGVLILIFKPYKVGDLIEVQDQMGHVLEVQIFNTVIKTLDNRTVIIPNRMANSDIITNLTALGKLRVEIEVSMPYSEDFDKVKGIILEALKETPGVLEAPVPTVGIQTFDSHSILLAVWPYALTEDYWSVKFEAARQIKAAMGRNGIKVAYSEGVELGEIG